MKRAATTCIVTAALLITPLLAVPAEARHGSGFSAGGWFSIGGVDFSLVFGSRGGHPDYYYRTDERVQYRGHRCTARCYRDRRYAYHSIDCPVVGYHLDRYRQYPHKLFRGHAPAPFWRGAFYGDSGHRSWNHGDRDRFFDRHYHQGPYYDRHDRRDRRYERHDRRDPRDRRYDRRDRRNRHRGWDRGHGRAQHRHDASCRHGRGH